MGNKTATQAKKAAADAKAKKKAADKKGGEKLRKPRMSVEDFSIIKFACESLIASEEERELLFHRAHTVDGMAGDVPVLFHGNYGQLCELLERNDQQHGTVIRTKAQVLLKRVAPHVSK